MFYNDKEYELVFDKSKGIYVTPFHNDLFMMKIMLNCLENTEYFIETCLFLGYTLYFVAKNFTNIICYYCEISEEYFNLAQNNIGQLDNLKIELNSSPQALYRLNKVYDDTIYNKYNVFWIDAHWCGNLPLLKYLLYIKEIEVNMSIHTIGDSHCMAGWEGVITHHIGALLCYSFGIQKLDRIDIRLFNINDGDTIIFCLGEIDCRCQIHKHITDLLKYETIIDNIIYNYFEAINLNLTNSNIKLKNICIFNVVPPVQKYNCYENPSYPFLGTDEERKSYVLYFNKKLKEECIKKNYIFFDVYDNYCDENGYLIKNLSDDNVHIKNGIYITNFINKFLL